MIHDIYDFDQISIIRNSIDHPISSNNNNRNVSQLLRQSSKSNEPYLSPIKPESYVQNPLKI